jgi:hypothetical protein
LKKSETKDQNAKHAQIEGLILNLTHFGANSHLNETTPFQTLFTYKKKRKEKKQKQCRFERHHISSSSSGRVENMGRRFFSLLCFSPTPSLP